MLCPYKAMSLIPNTQTNQISVCLSIIITIILLHFDSSQGGEIANIFIWNWFMEKYVLGVGWESSNTFLQGWKLLKEAKPRQQPGRSPGLEEAGS